MKCAMHRWVPVLALALATACAHQGDVSRESTQNDFGVNMARMNLWREAMFRFKKAVQVNPQDPMAHNNLAVAYEANGDFEAARREYLEALRLDRSNDYIKKNYSRFSEFLARNKKRSSAGRAADSGAAAPATPTAHGTSAQPGSGGPERPVGAPPDKPIAGDPGVIPRPQPPPPPPPNPPPPTPNPPQGGAA
jgi:Tfp pilus assembly protein PilF